MGEHSPYCHQNRLPESKCVRALGLVLGRGFAAARRTLGLVTNLEVGGYVCQGQNCGLSELSACRRRR